MNKSDPKLKAAILEAVNNQLKSGDPPETRQPFNRLIVEGISEEDASLESTNGLLKSFMERVDSKGLREQ